MKHQEAKAAGPSSPVHGKPNNSQDPHSHKLVLTCDHRNAPFEHWPRPTELQLAELAARLARTEQIDPKKLVNEAWDLYWESCRKIQQDHLDVEKMLQVQEVRDDEMWVEERGGLPQPDKFPVTFQRMEILLLPKLKGRTGERASVFREYAFAQLVAGSFSFRGEFRVMSYWDFEPEALQELRARLQGMVADRFGQWRTRVYDAAAYAQFAGSFLRWYCQWSERRNSEVKSANARKGWDKRGGKNQRKTRARPPKKLLQGILEAPSPKKSTRGA